MYCPKCGTENKAEDRFCKKCGTALEVVERDFETVDVGRRFCPKCGKRIKISAKFCRHCDRPHPFFNLTRIFFYFFLIISSCLFCFSLIILTAATIDPRTNYISDPWSDPLLIPYIFVFLLSLFILTISICGAHIFRLPKFSTIDFERYSRKRKVKFNSGIFILCLFVWCVIWGGAYLSYELLSTQNDPNDGNCDICGRDYWWRTYGSENTVIHEYCSEHGMIASFFHPIITLRSPDLYIIRKTYENLINTHW